MDAGRGGKWGRRHPLFHRHHPPWRSIIAAIGNRSTGQSSTMTICSFSSSGFSAQEICHATSSSIKSSSSSSSIRPIRRFHPHPGRGWRPRHSSIWFIHSIVFFSCNLTSPVRFKVIWRQWKRKKKKSISNGESDDVWIGRQSSSPEDGKCGWCGSRKKRKRGSDKKKKWWRFSIKIKKKKKMGFNPAQVAAK